MGYRIEFEPRALKELSRIDRPHQKRIVRFLRERVETLENPRLLGESLAGPLKRFWKYRVGQYRIICSIEDGQIRVLVVRIGNRREVYRG